MGKNLIKAVSCKFVVNEYNEELVPVKVSLYKEKFDIRHLAYIPVPACIKFEFTSIGRNYCKTEDFYKEKDADETFEALPFLSYAEERARYLTASCVEWDEMVHAISRVLLGYFNLNSKDYCIYAYFEDNATSFVFDQYRKKTGVNLTIDKQNEYLLAVITPYNTKFYAVNWRKETESGLGKDYKENTEQQNHRISLILANSQISRLLCTLPAEFSDYVLSKARWSIDTCCGSVRTPYLGDAKEKSSWF